MQAVETPVPVAGTTARPLSKKLWRILAGAAAIYVALLVGPVAGLDVPHIVDTVTNNPGFLLRLLVIGIANGAIFATIALGYTMVYGIIELINFAHGDVYMLCSFAALTVIALMGTTKDSGVLIIVITIVVALVAAVIFGGVVNATVERAAYRRLRTAPRLAPLLSAIGVSFILQNIGLIWAGQGYVSFLTPYFGTSGGAAQKAFPELIPNTDFFRGILGWKGFPVEVKAIELFVIAVAVGLMVALRIFIQRTKLGKAMRATAENRDAAKIMGINVDRVIATTFLIGGALAGAAALLNGLYVNTVWWFMGFQAGLRSFTAAVLGGIGNVTGAMLGGFLIGILSALSDGLLNPAWTRAWVFSVLVLVLVFRPTGLLGQATGDKA
jgi:branched-chain amino acid transport system permease protein